MANKQEFSANLKINAIVDQATKELNGFGQALSNAWKNGEPPKQMQKKYKSLETYLGSLTALSQQLTAENRKATGSELKQANSDYTAIQKTIHALTVEFGLMSTEQKRAMLSTEEQANMKARTAAIKEYNAVLAKNIEIQGKRKPLEEQRANLEKEQQHRRTKAQAAIDVSKPVLEALEKRGYLLSKEGEAYQNNLKWAEKYQKQLDTLNSKPNKTEADRKAIQKKQAEIDALDLTTGQGDYTNMLRYNDEVKKLKDSINGAQQELDEMDSALNKIDGQLAKLNLSDEAKAFQNLKDRLKELGVEGIEDAKDLAALEQAIKKLDAKALAKIEDSLKNATNGLNAFGASMKPVGKEIDEGTAAIERQNQALQEKEAFEAKIKQFLGIQGAAIVMRRALQDAMQTIKELDATMTEMAVVTDLSVGDYWEQLPEYTARANELGMAINDVYKADTLFYQQGLKTNEVVELSTQTIKMARVAGLDTAEATDRMTAALRGFNMELNETNAQNIADVYSKLAAITASDVNEISSAMTKTASIASNAGMEFETTAAFLAQIIETTRESAETAGTAMKTIIARFQELKKDPSEIGEVDGEIVDANKIETALRSVGVSLRDAKGQFRDLDDVFLELAQKWDGLDKNTQRYIATIAAGSRQQSRFIAMMSDYSRTQELVTAANNSAGASNEQFEKTMESLDAKLNELKNAWHEFTMGILESDLVKLGVDMLTKFLQVVNKATSGLGGIGNALTKIISVVAVFKLASKLFQKVETPLFNLYNKIVKESYGYGFKATQEYARGAQDATEQKQKLENIDKKTKTQEKQTKDSSLTTIKDKVHDVTGITKMGAVKRLNKAEEAIGKKDIQVLQKQQQEAYHKGWGPKGGSRRGEEAKQARKDYQALTKEIEEYKKHEADVTKRSQEAWKEVGQGVSQAGSAIAGLGIGLSAVGAILQEMGLEEFGKGVVTVGNWVTMLGGAISFVGGLVPIVANALAAAGIKVQTAWWPLLLIGLAIASIVAIIAGIVSAVEAYNAAKLENRMKAAAEATKKAQEAAEDARDAYDSLNDSWSNFKETQNTLEKLTEGTTEWKNALYKANLEVIALMEKYPLLSKYITRQENGQLIISDEGWKEIEQDAFDQVNNTLLLTMAGHVEEYILGIEQLNTESRGSGSVYKKYDEQPTTGFSTSYFDENGDVYYIQTAQTTDDYDELLAAMTEAYNGEDNTPQKLYDWLTETGMEQFHFTDTDTISLSEVVDNFFGTIDNRLSRQLAIESRNQVYLGQIASNTTRESEYGDEVITFFSAYTATENYQDTIDKTKASILGTISEGATSGDASIGTSNLGTEAQELFKEYNIEKSDNSITDLQKLYTAMTGVTEFGDDMDTAGELAEAIAKIAAGRDVSEHMDSTSTYLSKLEPSVAKKIVGLFTTSGGGYDGDTINTLYGSDQPDIMDGEITVERLNNVLSEYGLNAQDLAKAMGIPVEDLIETIQSNTKQIYLQSVENNKRLTRLQEKVKPEGENAETIDLTKFSLLTSGTVADFLGDFIVSYGEDLSGDLSVVLRKIKEEDQDWFARYISSQDFSDTSVKDRIKSDLSLMGIEFTTAIEDFIDTAMDAANAVERVDFSRLNAQLAATYDILQQFYSGTLGRVLETDQYNLIIEYAPELKSSFVQLGESFIYMGNSIEAVTGALERGGVLKAQSAKESAEAQSTVSDIMVNSKNENLVWQTIDGDKYHLDQDWTTVGKDVKARFLDNWLAKFAEEGVTEDQLSHIAPGLSYDTEFGEKSDGDLNKLLAIFSDLKADNVDLKTLVAETVRSSLIADRLQYTPEENATAARANREEEHFSEALIIQAIQSGVVSEQVISAYQQALEGTNEGEITKWENAILSQIKNGAKNIEAHKQISELQNKVIEALYEQRQNEIDQLTKINESINSANEKLISKVQEEIDTQREAREEEKTKQNIADLEAQRAYLLASGGSATDIAALDKQLSEAKEDYQDTLVDQALSNIQDANEKAAEQRQEQIDIAQQQLDYDMESGKLAQVAQQMVTDTLTAIKNGQDPLTTSVGQLFAKSGDWDALTESERKATQADTAALLVNASNISEYLTGKKATVGENNQITNEGSTTNWSEHLGTRNAQRAEVQADAATEGLDAAISSGKGSWEAIRQTTAYQDALDKYTSAGGTVKEFEAAVQGAWTKKWDEKYPDKKGEGGSFVPLSVGPVGTYKGFASTFSSWNPFDTIHKGQIGANGWDNTWYSYDTDDKDDTRTNTINSALSLYGINKPQDQLLIQYDGVAYVKAKEGWLPIKEGKDNINKLFDLYISQSRPTFKTGGLADFTGPAWLDGTKARPELVLNQTDTQNFIALKDILADVMKSNVGTGKTNTSSGNNYFDIEINVEKLDNDYDVDQIADKIRNMIYSDATRRNVNAVNQKM